MVRATLTLMNSWASYVSKIIHGSVFGLRCPTMLGLNPGGYSTVSEIDTTSSRTWVNKSLYSAMTEVKASNHCMIISGKNVETFMTSENDSAFF